ncbi:MAG: hypothetical protein LQ337_000413 [Flavoplaca oasis]|nr:MAG: hypothetical protein LQ337_000413 [Flavoplaca oasis]
MGNKISRAANDSLDRGPALPRPESGNQETLNEATQRKQFTKPKFAISSRNFSPSSAPLSSTSSSSSKTLRQQSTDTDGASSPKVEEFDMALPTPFQHDDQSYPGCDQYSSPIISRLKANFCALLIQTSIIPIMGPAFFKPAIVVGISGPAATSTFSNPVRLKSQGSSTTSAGNPFCLLPFAQKDAMFAEHTPSASMHGLWSGGSEGAMEMCLVLLENLYRMHGLFEQG